MRSSLIIPIALAVLLCSCSGSLQGLTRITASPADSYRQKAIDAEETGNLQQALLAWRIAAHLEPKDKDAAQAIKTLKVKISKSATSNFKQGLKHYKSGNYNKSLKYFLITIRIQPSHKQALYYLKTRLQNPEQTTYIVKPGDSFIRIASKIYKDPSKAPLIAFFNDQNPRKPLFVNTTLMLPSIDSKYLLLSPKIRNLLDKAQTAYKKKHYLRAISLSQKVIDEIPNNYEARRLSDASYYDQAIILLKRKRYMAAEELLTQVSPQYKKRRQAMAQARRHISQTATERKLKQAQKELKKGALEKVINICKEIMFHEPKNLQARMLFSNASYHLGKTMLDRGETVKAFELLSPIDPSYEDTAQLLSLARARMTSQAETHYRDGVKHFINEDLEMAITDWKKALKLHPEHPKARKDIENAERLLKKLKALEK